MSRRLTGHFSGRNHFNGILAPYIGALVRPDGSQFSAITFLIDTGADFTVISPRDAAGVFGHTEYEAIIHSNERMPIDGIGAGGEVVLRHLELHFLEGVQSLPITRRVAIAAELRNARGEVVNQAMPSVLGRDVLNDFTLTISPARNLVELIEEDRSGAP